MRDRVLAAVEAGENPIKVAQHYAVGKTAVYRWLREAREDRLDCGNTEGV
ncbi:IS630 transposase-related protein [Paracraurococcus lichenis]